MDKSLKLPSVPQGLLLAAIVLATISGGQISSDSQPLTSSPILAALTGDPSVPMLTVGIIAILVALAGGIAVLQRRVLQFPSPGVAMAIGLFIASLVASVVWSSFKGVSISAIAPWATYAAIYFVSVMVLGRQSGTRWLLTALFAGGIFVSLRGILEYGDMKPIDPTWRIFAGWVNPNATAAMLTVSLFAGIGLIPLMTRVTRLVTGLGATVVMAAIVLTQSKGALITVVVGLVVYGITALAWGRERKFAGLGGAVAVAIVGSVLAFAMMRPVGNAASTGGLGRIGNVSASQDQSAGFRQALWKGTVDLIKDRPLGYGIGTYRFESARPGITTQTVLAHNAYLQIAAESGVISLTFLLAAVGIWATVFLKGTRSQTSEIGLMKAAVITSIVAIGAHSLVDSDLYYFGIGAAFFALLGAGQLLAGDGVTPELIPARIRRMSIATLALFALIIQYPAIPETLKAQSRAALMTNDAEGAKSLASAALDWLPADGESPYMLARYSTSAKDRQALLATAAANAPSTRNLRALAKSQNQNGDLVSAVATLEQALRRDPNNLLTLRLLMQIQADGRDVAAAKLTAERLVAVEQTPYYLVRSLPDMVPTETAEAREFLANQTSDAKEAVSYLAPALAIYREYLARTWPLVDRATKNDPNGFYADETRPSSLKKLEIGERVATQLGKAYRATGDAKGSTDAEAAAADFRAALTK